MLEPPDHPIWQATRFWRYVLQDDGYAWVWCAAAQDPVPWVEVTIAFEQGSRCYVVPVVDGRLQVPAAWRGLTVGEFDQLTVADALALAGQLTGPIPVLPGMCPGELGEARVTVDVAGSQRPADLVQCPSEGKRALWDDLICKDCAAENGVLSSDWEAVGCCPKCGVWHMLFRPLTSPDAPTTILSFDGPQVQDGNPDSPVLPTALSES